MKTKLIITLNKELENDVFTTLWKKKYSSLGELTIESENLAKTLYIDNTEQSEAQSLQQEFNPLMVNNPMQEKSLSINDYTTELVITHLGAIKTIETLLVSEEKTEKTEETATIEGTVKDDSESI
jgi:hypothetical protein